jgi:phosphatidylglycerol:prolipoprotein diacylglycerol transferase
MHPHLANIGPIIIPTFGAVVALGLVLAITLAARGAKALGISEDAMWNLCLWIVGGTLILSRLVIVAQAWKAFFHYPLYILTLPTVTSYGLLIALFCGAAYILFQGMPWLRTLDALAPALLLLQAAIHLGSLFSGDDLGAPTTAAIGNLFKFDKGYHPVALYATLLSLAAVAVTYAWLTHETRSGEAFGLGLTLAALTRFIADIFRPSYTLPDNLVAYQAGLTAAAAVGLCFFFTRGPQARSQHAQ